MRRRVLLLNVLALVLVAGCSQEPKDWQTAAETDSEAGYEAYLAEHPDGEHAGDASDRLHVIRGNRAWQELAGDRNVEALQVFVDSYPDHEAIDEARFLLDIHKRAEEWGAEEMRVM